MADRRLQVFQAVAKQRSFTKAADSLLMTQPAVTFQIKQLEEHFNTRLFDRGHGKILLTPAGEMVLEYAEKILGLSNELDIRVAEMTGEVSGSLMIGASTTIAEFMLPRILGEFKSRHPKVQPRLIVANPEIIETHVAERLLDLGFVESHTARPTLQVESSCEDELQVVCSPGHPLANYPQLTPEQLLGHAFISREPGSGTRECTEAYLQQAGLNLDALNLVMEMGSPVSLNGIVETGLGYTIASRTSVSKAHRLGLLVAIPLKPRLTRTLSMISLREKFRSRLVNTFAAFAAEKIKTLVTP